MTRYHRLQLPPPPESPPWPWYTRTGLALRGAAVLLALVLLA